MLFWRLDPDLGFKAHLLGSHYYRNWYVRPSGASGRWWCGKPWRSQAPEGSDPGPGPSLLSCPLLIKVGLDHPPHHVNVPVRYHLAWACFLV